MRYPEGIEVQLWPEFQALADRLGIPVVHLGNSQRLTLFLDEGSVYIDHRYSGGDRIGVVTGGTQRPPVRQYHVTGYEVYQWPEFEAFCERAGIAWDLPTKTLKIEMSEGEILAVTQTYMGQDRQAARNGIREWITSPMEKVDTERLEEGGRRMAEEIERKILGDMTEGEMPTGTVTTQPVEPNEGDAMLEFFKGPSVEEVVQLRKDVEPNVEWCKAPPEVFEKIVKPPTALDTTNAHNKVFRTYQPRKLKTEGEFTAKWDK